MTPLLAPRLYVVDAARGFAVVAMVLAHTAPFVRDVAPSAVRYGESLLTDLAAPLFALLIGITIALTSRAAGATARSRGRYRVETSIKAVVLIVLGIVLGLTYSGVAVVLDYLGVTLLVALPFLFMRARTLFVLAAAFTAVSPLVVDAILKAVAAQPSLMYPWTPLSTVLDWIALAPSYRLVGLLPLYLLGLGLGRILFDRGTLPVLPLVVGSALVFAGAEAWRFLGMPGPGVRGGYYEVIRDTALAVGSFAVIYFLTDAASGRVRTVARRIFAPLAVQGTMALSIYVLHVVLLMGVYGGWLLLRPPKGSPVGWVYQIGLVIVCWIFAAVWWRWLGTGPLERLLGFLSGRRPFSSLWARSTRVALANPLP